VDRELFSPGVLVGGPDFESEVSKVFELGYRGQPLRELSYSLTAFYNELEDLRSLAPATGGLMVANDREGHIEGIEGWGVWHPVGWWRLSAGFVRMNQQLEVRPGAVDLQAPGAEGNDPKGWYKLRAAFDLGNAVELDVMVRHYHERPHPLVPRYTAVDARLGWRAARGVEVSLLGQGLFDTHPEWGASPNRAELERAAFVKLRLDL
jgi:iron complex outermembrane receptor protein